MKEVLVSPDHTMWLISGKGDLHGRKQRNTVQCVVFCCAAACSPETDRSVGGTFRLHFQGSFLAYS
jgi:hypothetical protein